MTADLRALFSFDPLLDRDVPARQQPDTLAARFAEPGARVLVVGRSGELVGGAAGVPAAEESHDTGRHHYLGLLDGTAWFARRTGETELSGVDHQAPTAREAAFGAGVQELIWAGAAVLNWHDTDPSCERCHGRTEPVQGGFVRRCLQCGAENYPRSDPAMIVAVLDDDDRLLLANNAARPGNRRSVLAGFVEAGESVETAVVREVAEESGLRVTRQLYLGSQPWPFPRSLMLGHAARAHGEPRPDEQEITAIDWYSRAELDAALAAGELALPGHASIARRMIEAWRSGALTAQLLDRATASGLD